MIIIAAVENDGAAFIDAGRPGPLKVTAAEVVADHAGLQDGEIEEIAADRHQAGGRTQRIGHGADHVSIGIGCIGNVGAKRLPGHGRPVRVDEAGAGQFLQHHRNTAGAGKAFAQMGACGRHVEDQRHAHPVPPVIYGDALAGVAGHGGDVGLGVCGTADRRGERDGIKESLAR